MPQKHFKKTFREEENTVRRDFHVGNRMSNLKTGASLQAEFEFSFTISTLMKILSQYFQCTYFS